MKTVILKVDPANPNPSYIERVVTSLRAGKLVAFPTDTVYGIGADVFNEDAVRQIFVAKKRDFDRPLQVLIAHRSDLSAIAKERSETLGQLASEFWPGPLTLVMTAKEDFPRQVRCGGDTIGVRIPANPITLKLIKAFGAPIAATSANISGHPDPVSAAEVLEYLGDDIDIILDGGPTPGNIPSTVLDISVHPPVVLRRGKLTVGELAEVLGYPVSQR